jgi:hypothetical protein
LSCGLQDLAENEITWHEGLPIVRRPGRLARNQVAELRTCDRVTRRVSWRERQAAPARTCSA